VQREDRSGVQVGRGVRVLGEARRPGHGRLHRCSSFGISSHWKGYRKTPAGTTAAQNFIMLPFFVNTIYTYALEPCKRAVFYVVHGSKMRYTRGTLWSSRITAGNASK
jgi:hypothetical protein